MSFLNRHNPRSNNNGTSDNDNDSDNDDHPHGGGGGGGVAATPAPGKQKAGTFLRQEAARGVARGGKSISRAKG